MNGRWPGLFKMIECQNFRHFRHFVHQRRISILVIPKRTDIIWCLYHLTGTFIDEPNTRTPGLFKLKFS